MNRCQDEGCSGETTNCTVSAGGAHLISPRQINARSRTLLSQGHPPVATVALKRQNFAPDVWFSSSSSSLLSLPGEQATLLDRVFDSVCFHCFDFVSNCVHRFFH